jgi:hypothetical protein
MAKYRRTQYHVIQIDTAGEAKSDNSGPWLGYLHVTRFRPTARQDVGADNPAGTDACYCSFEMLRGRHYVIVLLGWLPDVCSIGSAKSKIVPGHELIFCHLSFSRDLPRLRLINTCPGARCAGLSR